MSWTITGIIWIIMICICMFLPIRYIKALTMVSFLFQGVRAFSIALTETDIALSVLTTFFFLIKILISRRITINNTSRFLLFILVFVIIHGVIATNLFDGYVIEIMSGLFVVDRKIITFGSGFLVKIMYLSIFILSVILSNNEDNEIYDKVEFTTRVMKLMVVIVFIFGIIQYLESNEVIYTKITQTFIQNKLYTRDNSAFYRNYERLYSIFGEPSYCGAWTNGCLWYFFRKQTPFRYVYIIMCAIVLVLSLSGTGFVSFVLCAVAFFVFEKDRLTRRKILFLAGVTSLFLIITPVGQDIIVYVMTKLSSGSGVTRMAQNAVAWRSFIDSHTFGMGYEQVLGFKIEYTLLAQIGIIGFVLFCVFLYKEFRMKKYDNEALNYMYLSVVGSLFFSFSGIPHHGPLWSVICLNESMARNEANQVYDKNDNEL